MFAVEKLGEQMLLRRVVEHVEKQNWVAVVLDFFIVVTGVFIGIQLGNWNDAGRTRSAFLEASDRLVAESRANLEATDRFLEDLDARLAVARRAIVALRNCASDDVANEEILAGVNAIRGTPTLRLRQTALSAITGNDAFLSLLSEQERERLKEYERQLNQSQSTLNWLEERPFINHIEDAPKVDFGELIPLQRLDGVMIRNLIITAPLDEVCEDKAFLAPFYLWERTSTFQSLRASQVRDGLIENIGAMES